MSILTEAALGLAILCGDVNLDGQITALDAQKALNMAVNNEYSVEADTIANGVITASDAFSILSNYELNCPDVVDIYTETPVEHMTVYIDYKDGPGFIGDGPNVMCEFNKDFYWALASNNKNFTKEPQYFNMENFLAIAAIIDPYPNSPLVSGIMVSCLAFPGQELEHVESRGGEVFVNVR